MFNFWKGVLGLCLVYVGLFIFIWVTRKRIKGDKGGYGAHSRMYLGAYTFFIIGLIILIREIMKL